MVFEPSKLFKTYIRENENKKLYSHIFLGEISGNILVDEKEISNFGWFKYDEAIKSPLAFLNSRLIEDLHKEGYI